MTFSVGDIVRLKGGGAHMTVEAIDPDGKVVCVWHDFQNVFHREALVAGALQLV